MKTIFLTASALAMLLLATVEGRAYAPTDTEMPDLRPKPRPPLVCIIADGTLSCWMVVQK